jgi:tetratricopeptide (TPR) repeat protein
MKRANLIKISVLLLLPMIAFSQTDNSELQKMYNEDQGSRKGKDINWAILSKQDKERESRVLEMINSKQIITGKDYYNSAMIFQHGNDTLASSMAVKHMKKAIELDTTVNRWLLAAAIDRDLMRRQKPQIYGTQFVKNNGESNWKRYDIDTTKVTDKERQYYRVEILSEQLMKERNMNLTSISDFHSTSTSIDETINFIISENKKGLKSTYNTSESAINSFAYNLLNAKNVNDALVIFTLNTQLYPSGFNTFDSLGECLLILGKTEEGLKAYKKSLELNPKNVNAKKIINGEK